MKKVIMFLSAILLTAPTMASQLGCEQTISISMSQMFDQEGIDEVVRNVTLVDDGSFANVAIYSVLAGKPVKNDQLVGIPYASYWAVMVKKGPMGTCEVVGATHDMTAL